MLVLAMACGAALVVLVLLWYRARPGRERLLDQLILEYVLVAGEQGASGLEITDHVEKLFPFGTIYPTLKKLEARGLIRGCVKLREIPIAGGRDGALVTRQRFWVITEAGRDFTQELALIEKKP